MAPRKTAQPEKKPVERPTVKPKPKPPVRVATPPPKPADNKSVVAKPRIDPVPSVKDIIEAEIIKPEPSPRVAKPDPTPRVVGDEPPPAKPAAVDAQPIIREVPADAPAKDTETVTAPPADDAGAGMSIVGPDDEADTPTQPAPAAKTLRVTVMLPPLFRNAGLPDGVLSLRSRKDKETLVDCAPESFDPAQAMGIFQCERSPNNVYRIALAGFEELPVRDSGRGADTTFEWAAENMKSLKSAELLPATLETGEPPPPPFAIGASWSKLLSGDEHGFLSAAFGAIDPASAAAGSVCGLAEPQAVTAATLVDASAEIVPMRLDCDFIMIDYDGLPAPKQQFRPEQCQEEAGAGPVCVLREIIDTDGGPAISIAGHGLWGASTIAAASGIRLADYVAFTETFSFWDGTGKIPVGDRQLIYRVESATGSDGKTSCPGVWKPGEGDALPLGQFTIAQFDCSSAGLVLDKIVLRLNLSDDAGLNAPRLLKRFDYDISASETRIDTAPAIDQILKSVGLEVVVDPAKLPAFSSLRLFENEEICKAGVAPVQEAGLSSTNRRLEVSGQILRYIQNGRARIFDRQRPITACEPIRIVAATGPDSPLLSIEPAFLRPEGATSLLVLSPSASMANSGWRAPITAAIREWAKGLFQAKTAVPVDMVEIAENRRTQTIMASEDFSFLPEEGGTDSLLGRLDRVRFNAGVSRPLDDINLVESEFSGVEFNRVLLIVDSSDEKFDPREMGSFYHWLINRRVALRILTIGECEGWAHWTRNLDNKAECLRLDGTSGGDRQERQATIRASLDWLLGAKGALQ